MPKGINYGQLMQKAVRQMIAEVLARVAREGLPGKHHFFITFDTTHPGVDMSASLRERYPGQMMIVMQEWFEDLAVMKDRFSVTLSFGNVPESLVIPFDAIITFVDPSVEFGVRLDAHEEGAAPGPPEEHEPPEPTPLKAPPDAKPSAPAGAVVSLDQFRKT